MLVKVLVCFSVIVSAQVETTHELQNLQLKKRNYERRTICLDESIVEKGFIIITVTSYTEV